MITYIRTVALLNAAVWLGATALHALLITGAFGSPEMIALLGPLHAGGAGELVSGRFAVLTWVCAAVAGLLVLAEWLYTGRPPERWLAWLLGALLALQAVDTLVVQPRAARLLRQAYLGPERTVLRQAWTPAQINAASGLRWSRHTSRTLQSLSTCALALLVWHTAHGVNATRFSPRVRLRI